MADMLVTQCDAHDNCLLSPSSTDVCLGEPSFTPHSTTCSQQELRLYCRSLHHCPHVSCICQHDVACYRLWHMLAQAGLHFLCDLACLHLAPPLCCGHGKISKATEAK